MTAERLAHVQGFEAARESADESRDKRRACMLDDAVVDGSSGVVDRARQHVQVVVQTIELVPGDHQLVLAQLELGGPLARHPIPLAASL